MLIKIYFIIVLLIYQQPDVLSNKSFNPNANLKNRIIMSMDNSVDPCEDFYAYTCNNYEQQNLHGDFKEITGEIDYNMNVYLRNLMETCYQFDNNVADRYQTFVDKTRIYYKSCYHERKRNLTKYFEQLKPAVGINWPILEDAQSNNVSWPDEQQFDVFDLVGKLQSYGLNNLIVNRAIEEQQDGSFSIQIEPAYFGDTNSLPDPLIIRVLLNSLGIQNNKKQMAYLQNLKNTHENLLYLQLIFTETEDSYEYEFQTLPQIYPNLDLTAYLRHLMPVNLETDTKIIIKYSKYFQYLNDRYSSLQSAKTDLCNYFMIKFLHFLITDAAAGFTKLDCIKDLRNKMDLAVNYLYYHHDYQCKAEKYTNEIYKMQQNIKTIMWNLFNENHLNLTKNQIEQLQLKLEKLQMNLGNLPYDVSRATIEEFYKDIEPLDETNYYRNHLLLLRHRFVKSLNYAQNQSHFIVPDNFLGSSSSPFYVPHQNMIILPFGSLNFPMFHEKYYEFYKWSMLGFVLAHEFTHGFDTTGLNFDMNGTTLAEPSAILENRNFVSSLQCMQEQEFTEAIDERIADLVAIRIVYQSYLFRNITGTWQRRFFLNLAQFFCGTKDINFIDHDADSTRLNLILMNFEEFAKTFTCPLGSQMNPVTKCRLY